MAGSSLYKKSHVAGALRAPPRPRFELEEELLWRGSRFGECRGPASTWLPRSHKALPTPEPRRPIGHAIACGAGTYAAAPRPSSTRRRAGRHDGSADDGARL